LIKMLVHKHNCLRPAEVKHRMRITGILDG